ncbi:MOP flippase family protein [Bacillus safensis]|uniref:teichuronic acid biosynthesis protein TuaB n=1 Tax=Bacillus safensis TaxID=561879 RepID=UPI002237105A|nr:MOP flippase family protein [Bacillus safensis]MCW4645119.1 MOP flippase family protein [Bacillus safensis]MCY7566359.1 MOP flippase family protein [Bacillus safensis]MCY7624229.1 MOP flippase family protein [Bacillus safensis]MCY7634010.1 MOP flippase family protein [Bacillus safensis]MCY7648420.1 MOP flippase family protein [Bacillus safensis]
MASMKKRMLGGAKWTSLSALIITIIQIAQFAFLGNVMSLKEFGLVGMITTVTIFTQILLDLGIGAAIIQKEQTTERQLSTLYWINLLTGILLFCLLILLSPMIAAFYNRPELEGLLKLLSIMFLIAPIGQQYQYMMQKDLAFKTLSTIEAIATIISLLVLLVFAFFMNPIVAYVISQVLLQSGKGLMYAAAYWKKWRPAPVFALREVKEFFSFGAFQLASRLVNRAGSNIDMILIGRFLGAEALGIYSLAYQIVTIPVLKINPIVTRVAFPVFAKSQRDHSMLREGFLSMTNMLALVSFPLLIGLAAVSDSFIEVVFGEKWLVAVPVLNILCIVGLLRVLMNPNGSILLAKGRADLAFYWDTGMLIVYGCALYAGVTTGSLLTVAWIYSGVSLLNFIVGRWLMAYVIQLDMKVYLKSLGKPAVMTLLMAVCAIALHQGMKLTSADISLQLLLTICVSAALYGLLLIKMYPQAAGKLLRRGRSS